MKTAGAAVPIEALATLRRRLTALSGRHPQREALLASTAELYGVSRATLYQLLRGDLDPARSRELIDEMRAAGLPT